MDKLPDDLKDEITALFDEYRIVYLGTIEEDRPRVRPVTLNMLDSRFWILTGTEDAKMCQLRVNPNVEACHLIEKEENHGYFRFAGTVRVIDDMAVKEDISSRVDYFSKYWDSHEHPGFALLEVVVSEVEYLKPGDEKAVRYQY